MCFAKISQKETFYEKLYIINNVIWLPKKERNPVKIFRSLDSAAKILRQLTTKKAKNNHCYERTGSWMPSGTQTLFSGECKIFYVILLKIRNSNRRWKFSKRGMCFKMCVIYVLNYWWYIAKCGMAYNKQNAFWVPNLVFKNEKSPSLSTSSFKPFRWCKSNGLPQSSESRLSSARSCTSFRRSEWVYHSKLHMRYDI